MINIASSLADGIRGLSERGRAKLSEFIVWLAIFLIVDGRVILEILGADTPQGRFAVLNNNYYLVLFGSLIIIGPTIFNLVFGALPFEILRIRRMDFEHRVNYQRGTKRGISVRKRSVGIGDEFPVEAVVLEDLEQNDGADGLDPIKTLARQAESSKMLANSIYNRAGVYLVIGALTAFSGLVFFYLENSTSVPSTNPTSVAVALIPRAGILLFIEFIAFFFLRQYRSAMDEFRYYESIKREREEMIFSLIAFDRCGDPKLVIEAIRSNIFSSKVSALEPGYSTEQLETRRIEGSDMAGIAKILEGIAAFKK